MKKILYICLGLVLFLTADPVWADQPAELKNLTSESYSYMDKGSVSVIMFTAAYCGPCRLAKKILFPELLQKYASAENVHFFALDVEKDIPAPNGTYLKDQWGVNALPTFVIVYNDTVMYSSVGFSRDKAPAVQREIENKINALK